MTTSTAGFETPASRQIAPARPVSTCGSKTGRSSATCEGGSREHPPRGRAVSRRSGARLESPGFLLARLALSEDLHGQGRGGELLAGAVKMTLAAIRLGGGRVIVVDAIDDRAAAFYEHFGFRAIPANPNRVVMKASTAAASLSIDWS